MRVFFKIIFLIVTCLNQVENTTVQETPITNITKLIADHYQSSCVISLHTEERLQNKHREIVLFAENLARDLQYSHMVATVNFQKFAETLKNNGKIAYCNSPVILFIHNDKGTRQQLRKVIGKK